jgi:hypothetical protein
MKYQLVLQWPTSPVSGYDALIGVEDTLIEGLPSDCEVDGHDEGFGQMNIFIGTDSPKKTFEDVKAVLADGDMWSNIRIAYRRVDGSKYEILWPEGLKEFSIA